MRGMIRHLYFCTAGISEGGEWQCERVTKSSSPVRVSRCNAAVGHVTANQLEIVRGKNDRENYRDRETATMVSCDVDSCSDNSQELFDAFYL